MHVHFQNWSERYLLESLEKRNLPHGNRIIKVFATAEDPRAALGRSALTVIPGDPQPFSDQETYSYPGRQSYSGPELEGKLADTGLEELGVRTTRALFRFSNQHGFCQAAMAAKSGEDWLIDHPFGDIDGLGIAAQHPKRQRMIHLDIFFPGSLNALSSVVDYEDPQLVLNMREGVRFLARGNTAGQT
jgi:hypothetical protein